MKHYQMRKHASSMESTIHHLSFYIRRKLIAIVIVLQFSTASPIVNGQVSLTGSGATFPAEVYESWMPSFQYFRSEHVSIDLEYSEVGSTEGKMAFLKEPTGNLMYAGTDAAVRDKERNSDYFLVPVIAGAVVVAYNLFWIESLTLTQEALVGIFNGTIWKWDDPLLQAINPNVTLPPVDIRVVVRADDSGTTEIFTAALSSFSPAWAEQYGTFSEGVDLDEVPMRWSKDVPALLGRTNRGVAGIVYSYIYSIGYVSVGESRVGALPYAKIVNSAGNAVRVGHTSAMRRVMHEKLDGFTDDLTCRLVDSALPDAYPILGYSYFLIRKDVSSTSGPDSGSVSSCAGAMELYRYLEWILTDAYAAELAADKSFSQVLPEVTTLVTSRVLRQMTCSGASVETLVAQQKDDEYWQQQLSWTVPAVILIAVTGVLVLLLVAYGAYQQAILRRAMAADLWYIAPEYINITLDQSKGWPSGISGVTSPLSDDAAYAWPASVAKVGVWRSQCVLLRRLPAQINRQFRCMNPKTKMLILKWRTKIRQANLLYCHGLTCFEGISYIVSEHASKGALSNVLQNSRYQLGDEFKFSMATDITSGVDFLHRQGLIHGGLSSHCCYLDARWNVKVADWELLALAGDRPAVSSSEADADNVARGRYWTAPELILLDKVSTPTRQSDVYSLSILLVEIFSRKPPYNELANQLAPQPLIQAVATAGLRPNIQDLNPESVRDVIRQCWDADPTRRPTSSHVTKVLSARRPTKRTLIEGMMETLESHICTLEERVQERTAELAQVHRNLEGLLHQILPPSVASHLVAGRHVTPETYDSVTIYFSDVVGFTSICADSSPMEVVTFLNDLYSTFDNIIDKFDVYKVETIGDAYMVVSGLPERNGIAHAASIANMSLQFLTEVAAFRIRHKPDVKPRLRVGVHSGSVVAGVVGSKMPRYCVFGNTVNIAAKMEATSEPMKIQVSYSTYMLLIETGGFDLTLRGELELSIKEKIPTFFLYGPK